MKNIFESGELDRAATVSKMEMVRSEGRREVTREVEMYNLDAIIAVGYRVNSYQATQFRIWATRTLREFIIKGFVLDDERMKQGKTVFGKDYFDDLLERIREIRSSERRFYQEPEPEQRSRRPRRRTIQSGAGSRPIRTSRSWRTSRHFGS